MVGKKYQRAYVDSKFQCVDEREINTTHNDDQLPHLQGGVVLGCNESVQLNWAIKESGIKIQVVFLPH